MSEGEAADRIGVIWSPEARADLRAFDREPALQILHCLDRYLAARHADVRRLQPPHAGFRLRCGDCRFFFDLSGDNAISVTGVRHRRDAYR